MPQRTIRDFVLGPAAPEPAEGMHPVVAVIVALGILAAGQIVPVVVLAFLGGPGAGTGEASLALAMLGAQIGMAAAVLAVAAWPSGTRDSLRLRAPVGGARDYLYAFALMVPILALVNVVAYTLSPEGFIRDFLQFSDFVRGPQLVLAFAVIAVGAPLWEELLFRGFLLPPLARRLGFWLSAALVSAAWTALHFTYSISGLAEVFLIGLYLAWLVRRTGSLWVPIACHAAYNGILFWVIRLTG